MALFGALNYVITSGVLCLTVNDLVLYYLLGV